MAALTPISSDLQLVKTGADIVIAWVYLGLAITHFLGKYQDGKTPNNIKKQPVKNALKTLIPCTFFLAGVASFTPNNITGIDANSNLVVGVHILTAITGFALLIFYRQIYGKSSQHTQYQQLMQLAIDNIPAMIFWKDRNSIYEDYSLHK